MFRADSASGEHAFRCASDPELIPVSGAGGSSVRGFAAGAVDRPEQRRQAVCAVHGPDMRLRCRQRQPCCDSVQRTRVVASQQCVILVNPDVHGLGYADRRHASSQCAKQTPAATGPGSV
jgi:hypothetical protein